MSEGSQGRIVIYQEAERPVEVRLDTDQDTVWLSQVQMAELFDVKPKNITMHLKNVYAEGELSEDATCKDFLQVQRERIVIYQEAERPVELRLDAERDTVLLSQQQMAEVFDTSMDTISLHLKHIYRDRELPVS